MIISVTAYEFYKQTYSLSPIIYAENELIDYYKALYSKYSLPIENIFTDNNLLKVYNKVTENKKVLVSLSGGKDSVATLLYLINNEYEVFPFHVRNINKSSGKKEFESCQKICEYFGLSLIVHNFFEPSNIKKHEIFKENPSKNQFIYYLALYLMQLHNIYNIAFGLALDSYDLDSIEYFSDTILSFNLFKNFAEKIIGEHKLIIPFKNDLETTKYIYDNDKNLLNLITSCRCQYRFFNKLRNDNLKKYKDLQLFNGMCGSCSKCRFLILYLYKIGIKYPDSFILNCKNKVREILENTKDEEIYNVNHKYNLNFMELIGL